MRARATGLEVLESTQFRMQCFQTATGTKFLIFTEPQQPNVDVLLKRIYELYSDFVMKNPFYTVEMPIRCEKFDRSLDSWVKTRG
jgi:trafficking protein particle complex subunit 4